MVGMKTLTIEATRDAVSVSGLRNAYGKHLVLDGVDLAEAGVPLARIKELLAADADRFAAAMAEIDRNLQERAAELRRTRERIARLRAGDRLFVSGEVADFPRWPSGANGGSPVAPAAVSAHRERARPSPS